MSSGWIEASTSMSTDGFAFTGGSWMVGNGINADYMDCTDFHGLTRQFIHNRNRFINLFRTVKNMGAMSYSKLISL